VVKDPKQKNGSEIMIPALESVVLAVDLDKRIMKVDLPEGLL
jgi:ribosomal 30S subunit maturation factor RimM